MGEATLDTQILSAVTTGQAVLFLGAGFNLAEHPTSGQRDKGGLRDHLVADFGSALRDATLDIGKLGMEDLVLCLETRGSVGRRAIEDSIRRFLGESDALVQLEVFSLLRTLYDRRPDLFDTIITTNWDTGVETTLAGVSGLSVSVISDDLHPPAFQRDNVTLFKIHGDIARQDSRLVISSADFDLFERSHSLTVERLRAILSSRYLLVLGYSAKDDNFRRLLRHLKFDLGQQFRGGWILTPSLAEREELWTSQVGLRHIPCTGQQFLEQLIGYATTDPLGHAGRRPRKGSSSPKRVRFTRSEELDSIALELKEKYKLRSVWLVEPRSWSSADANARVDYTFSYALENLGRQARSLSLSTGRTVERALEQLDTSWFRNPIDLFSTVVVLNAVGDFRDPSSMVDSAATLFGVGRSTSHVVRVCGIDESEYDIDLEPLEALARALISKACSADAIISSVRPFDWLGREGDDSETARGRTQPYHLLFPGSAKRIRAAFEEAGVVAISHMIPLNEAGDDVYPLCYRPWVRRLRGSSVLR